LTIPDNKPRDQADELPTALVARLKAVDRAPPLITARVDRHLRAAAEAQFAGRRADRRHMPRAAWAAIAASFVLGLFIVWERPAWDGPMQVKEAAAPVYADVDGSGRIDIADVLALARARGADPALQSELDAFARRIVALTPAGEAS
jgi:hypothetical protein